MLDPFGLFCQILLHLFLLLLQHNFLLHIFIILLDYLQQILIALLQIESKQLPVDCQTGSEFNFVVDLHIEVLLNAVPN